ncbi:isoleucine--tRNA ligase [Opitutales bacterium]|nr:isoleucine--tRNA ligase [Opitutales bacterium]
MNAPEKLKDTLNLPKTNFPMRANAVVREPARMNHWETSEVYAKMQKKNQNGPSFVLHDGPPFTNGDVHVGTALNKILKDSILRYKNARGFRTPFLPGWDCHGLPIEHKVTKKLRASQKEFDAVELRKECEEFSKSYIETQRSQFKRLGVLADWEKEYKTMNPAYEAEILRTFADFVDQGLVYRSKKPVYWSIPCQTALAEAEIEYLDHKSPSIFVRFQIKGEKDEYLVIWTTTPWTLPANLAVAVHPRETYSEVQANGSSYWIAEQRVNEFTQECGFSDHTIGRTCTGSDLAGKATLHPFIDRDSMVVNAEYVTMDTGTGCVHIAPGHGLDDYLTGLEHDLEIYCPLDDGGKYLDDGQIPKELVGLSVLEKADGSKANHAVLEILTSSGALLAHKQYDHQYPHCWRSKSPVIFRAMDQWFVSLDKEDLRSRCINGLKEVSFTPEWGRNRIHGFLEARPDWCISRQRSWGVPIPVFFDDDGNVLLDSNLIEFLASKISQDGCNLWFSQTAEELLHGYDLPDSWKGRKLSKGQDTLDVWIDSGCSHRAVLRKNEEVSCPADLYLEGSDQHRGWFQSSLWTSMVSTQSAPYRRILTHGFVVNGEGKKISKSDGKPQTADSFVTKYGADVLRLWVCSEDFRRDIPLSDEILEQAVRAYRTLRNTLRFQLGALHDFSQAEHSVPIEQMSPIDLWTLGKTNDLIREVTDSCEQYEFHRAIQCLNRFCSGILSSTYHDVIKDRLYTLDPNDPLRRSTQSALRMIFESLIKLIGPFTPYIADEAWAFGQSGEEYCNDSLSLQDWPKEIDLGEGQIAVSDVQELLDLKDSHVNEALESLRVKKEIGQSLDACVSLCLSTDSKFVDILKRRSLDELAELFIVSSVTLENLPSGEVDKVTACHASGIRCPRSWRWVPELVKVEPWGEVSPRCAEVLAKIR